MKSTRSSSGSARRRSSSSAGDKKESEGSKQKPLRRSTRERESTTSFQPPESPVGSPKSLRTRRRTRGLSVTSGQRGDAASVASADEVTTPKQGKARATSVDSQGKTRSTTKGSSSKSTKKQESVPSATKAATTEGPQLLAVQKNGAFVRVKLLVNGSSFVPDDVGQGKHSENPGAAVKTTGTTIIGNDGNLFSCRVCGGFGDVVCCDACPHVFHAHCLPEGSESRLSLENDDDPWYCPDCMKERNQQTPAKQGTQAGRSEGSSRRAIKHRCQECQQTRSDLSLRPCEVCTAYIHHPPCRGSTPPTENTSILCSSCRAEAAVTQEEHELQVKKKRRLDEEDHEKQATADSTLSAGPQEPTLEHEDGRAKRRTRSKSIDNDNGDDGTSVGADKTHDDNSGAPDRPVSTPSSAGHKRKAREAESPDESTKSEKKKKNKKKKRKRDSDAHLPSEEASTEMAVASPEPERDESSGYPDTDDATGLPPLQGPPTQATPAFHFYLAEQRPKIEKVLSRKHRYFNRLPKGGERNALIAKEAAMQWVKLSSVDQKKYINMSMHDYESRIIAWKEEKNIRDMLVEPEAETEVVEEEPSEEPQSDDILTYEMHERLYMGTSVGSKPYKPEPSESHNRVLLDLLRDMRFHPLPMVSISRPENEAMPNVRSSKGAVQHFDVHGPIATSVGDECLGCTRGWPHFCPVLQRRMPAVEHRSRLQPAASALLSSRVGLGLRPRLERTEAESDDETNSGHSELLTWRNKPDPKVRFVPSGTLSDPSSRADDIVQFIEEVVAMKVPVPPTPPRPSARQSSQTEATPKKSSLVRGTLPTRNKRSDSSVNEGTDGGSHAYASINKCGRCRTIIMNEFGCVQCRRAQLVINTSKRQGDQQDSLKAHKHGLMKVQTAMLGRVITKDAIGELQAETDRKVSKAILKERWSPSAVLPLSKTLAPSPNRRDSGTHEKDSSLSPFDEKNEQEEEAADPSESQEENAELRSRNRRATAAPTVFETNDADRQNVARQNREEIEKITKRTLSIACRGILLALLRRDPLLLFAQPVSAENYEKIVRKPMDFNKIKNSVLNNRYHSLGAFVADVRLLCENALIYNPAGSIYSRTAKEILDALLVMQKRASKWMSAIKNSHTSFWRKTPKKRKQQDTDGAGSVSDLSDADPLKQLRQTWPEAVEMYENNDWMRDLLNADFSRTKENEAAFYGSLATRRAAKAAEVCLAPYTDTGGVYSACVKRSEAEDEELRQLVDSKVAEIVDPVQLRDIATGREETIVRLLRRVQNRRLEHRIGSDNGCARCDGMGLDPEMKAVMNADARWGRSKKKGELESESRVAASRLKWNLTTGLASAKTRQRIKKLREQSQEEAFDSVNDVCVSLRGSRIHGWGLFAEQPFKKGDVVSEYVGECVGLPVADAREKMYQDMRIKDYQFRLDDSQIIDATMKGGLGRYINHNCNPNCYTKIIAGKPPNQHLRRVLILALRDIAPREEISYDYQFPLETNLEARIPCNCQSDICRGFMNWDLPEKGANTGAIRTQKRGANMRDRIRRLGRPLKK